MADFTALKTAIQTYIKENGNEEITGEKLQEILLSMVTTLGDSAINDLITALNDEVAARQNADGTLQQNITNEATVRGNADTALGGRIDDEATARANGDTALANRLGSTITAENTAADQIGAEAEARAAADTALQDLIDGITENIENGYVYAGIATPSSTPATGKVFYLALTAGTYTNFGSTVVSQGINILKYNGSAWSLDAFIGIDDVPTPSSTGIPKSGGTFDFVMDNGSAFDISAHFASGGTLATYADLSDALTALNTLSADYKRGGMSIKFVLTSDNKYVQYRLMSDEFTTDTTQWAIADEGVYVENPGFIAVYLDADDKILKAIKKNGKEYLAAGLEVHGDISTDASDVTMIESPEFFTVWMDKDDKILFGIQNNGNFYFGCGVPQQVIDYINAKIAELSLDEYEDIVTFLNGLETGDKTLQDIIDEIYAAINTKVDKVTGKSLIDEDVAERVHYEENPEFISVELDADDHIIEATKKDGTKYFAVGINVSNVSIERAIVNPEFLGVFIDDRNHILIGFQKNGNVYFGCGIPSQIKAFVDRNVEKIQAFLEGFGNDTTLLDYLNETYGKYIENSEYIDVELDHENKVLGGRKKSGKRFECVGFETPNISIDGVSSKVINDVENRLEISTDIDERILSYRRKDGVKVEKGGLITTSLEANSFKLPKNTQEEVADISNDVAYHKAREYNLPKFGYVDIVSEIFYLTADERYSDINGVYLIRDNEDTDANAKLQRTLDFFYIKSTLTDNGDGTYSKNANSVKLDFYPAGKVSKIEDKYYVTSSLGEGGVVEPDSIEVSQLTSTPQVTAWPVNKKDEHYCTGTIDFGHYLSGTFKVGVKFQGSSTLGYRKRNFRFTFYKNAANPYYPYGDDKFGKKDKIKIGEFVRLSGFNLKANWTDSSRVKEAIMYRLLEAVWEVKGSVENYPWEKEFTAYTGATGIIKGFPIECNVGGEFYGYDIFGLKKDGKNYMLDKDKDGMLECGTRGNYTDDSNWTDAKPIDWEDELNDEEDWVIEHQTQSNFDALTEFFAFINGRLYKAEDESTYLVSQVTKVGSKFYVTSTLTPGEGSVTATRTNDPAYVGSDDDLYILSELTEISGTLYVTATLVDGQPTADSVTATLVAGGHNIYLGTDGERYLSSDLITINEVKYVPSKIVWDTTNATEVTLIPFDKKTMPERMSIEHWLKYIVCMQVFLMRDNTCRNMMLYTGADKKKFYPFFYDLDLSWNFALSNYNLDIMVPAGETPGSGVSYAGDMSLWENFKSEYWDEIINCYHILREKVLNIPYMINVMKEITDSVPENVLYKERIKWGTTITPFDSYISVMEKRLKWLDEAYFI